MITSASGRCVVWDLDDTLYDERSFVRSGYRAVATAVHASYHVDCGKWLDERFLAGQWDGAFQTLAAHFGLPVDAPSLMIATYRNHRPDIQPRDGIRELLVDLKRRDGVLACITDGRGVTQRNKLGGLGLTESFDFVLISEETGYSKPDEYSYREVMRRVAASEFWYVADNPAKDFVAPNALHWRTVQVLAAGNVHFGSSLDVPPGFAAQIECQISDLARVLLGA